MLAWLKKQLTGHEEFPVWMKCLPGTLLVLGLIRFVLMGCVHGWLLALSEALVWLVLMGLLLRMCLQRCITRMSQLEAARVRGGAPSSLETIREADRAWSGDFVYIPPDCEHCCDVLPLWACFLIGCGAMC